METKKQVKVSLGIAICIFLMIVLVTVIIILAIQNWNLKDVNQQLSQKYEENATNMQATISQLQGKVEVASNTGNTVKGENTVKEETTSLNTNQSAHFDSKKGKIVSKGATYTLEQFAFEGIGTEANGTKEVGFIISAGYDKINFDGFENEVKRKIGSTEKIKGFSKNVKESKIGMIGLQIDEGIILFLMEDGTVEYIGLKDAFTTNNLKTRGKLKGLNNIVKIETARVGFEEGGGIETMVAIDKDSNFYAIDKVIENQKIKLN